MGLPVALVGLGHVLMGVQPLLLPVPLTAASPAVEMNQFRAHPMAKGFVRSQSLLARGGPREEPPPQSTLQLTDKERYHFPGAVRRTVFGESHPVLSGWAGAEAERAIRNQRPVAKEVLS